ncbi:hypothetical protein SV7mr_21900 [Stieleria bergensis]|uniref:Intein C-terminal splicing domain-containing protein n=2 Tax=Stieleria bergensis TaxID=2528025 RepID=A0A517SU77_9BACT|nr:hypothetical protein SV7mr_21900 [Planctomycetes bacterium SV_7m_r]
MQELRVIRHTDQSSDPDTENAPNEAPVPRRLLRLCAALVMVICAGWLLIESMRSDSSPDLSPSAVTPVDSSQQPHSATKAIKDIQVGERVLAENPELHQAQRTAYREPDWNQWLQLSLVMLKEDGSELNIELLRSEDWVRRQLVPIHAPFADKSSSDAPTSQNELHPKVASQNPGDVPDVPLSPLRPVFRELVFQQVMLEAFDRELIGVAIEMDLPELAITGPALLVDMQTAPLIKAGQGRVVTATFQHTNADVIDLTIEDAVERETIGTTSNHPFWSEDRQAFVQAGSLKSGERVRTYLGDQKQVISLLARPGPQEVYNLEVHAEHVYYVGEFGTLVHNAGQYAVTPKPSSTLNQRVVHTRKGQFGNEYQASRGRWTGQRGRSKFIPSDTIANAHIRSLLSLYNVDGVTYRMGKVNLSPFAHGKVTVTGMTANRTAIHARADELLARQWNVKTKDVVRYRRANKLSWHEWNNMRTMELVPTEINDFFKHLGGIGEINLLNR